MQNVFEFASCAALATFPKKEMPTRLAVAGFAHTLLNHFACR
jgi:hypothetical protein